METMQRVNSDADCAQVARLAKEIWESHFTPIIGKAQVAYMLGKFQSQKAISEQIVLGFQYFLIFSEGRPVGYLGFECKESGLFLSKLYLLENARGKGLGKAALAFLKKAASQAELSRIYLTVNKCNTLAIKAYLAMGFRKTSEQAVDIGGGFVMDDFVMEKKIG